MIVGTQHPNEVAFKADQAIILVTYLSGPQYSHTLIITYLPFIELL